MTIPSRRYKGIALLAIAGLFGCSSSFHGEDSALELRSATGAPLDSVSPVGRIVVEGVAQIPLEDIWLVVGEVSSTTKGRIRRRDIPASLEQARQPLLSYREGLTTILAPSVVLTGGETYSIVALGAGLLGVVTVAEESRPVLQHWGRVSSEGRVLERYCLGIPPFDSMNLGSEPLLSADDYEQAMAQVGAEVGGFGKELCVLLSPEVKLDEFMLPPESVGEWLVEPTPLSLFPGDTAESDRACEGACSGSVVSGVCAVPGGGAIRLELCAGAYLVQVESEANSPDETSRFLLISAEAGRTHFWGPLQPEELQRITVLRLDDEDAAPQTVSVESGPAAPHLVLTEVLADPLGPEPMSEWVELRNLGTAEASLLGLQIWDEAGGTPLPDLRLAPGEIGLIVRDDFVVGPDIVPDAAALAIVVPSIGKNGLRNSGETVSLRDATGAIISQISARNCPEGVSAVRTDPWAPDGESSIIEHPAPGASPGL